MSKFRYPTSLILSSLLYGGVVLGFAQLLHERPLSQKHQESVIKVAIITPAPLPMPPKPMPKKIEPILPPQPPIKKEEPKPKPKPKPKKIIKKSKPKPKPKKIVKKHKPKPVIKKRPIIKKPPPEPVVEEEVIFTPSPIVSPPTPSTPKAVVTTKHQTKAPKTVAPKEDLSAIKRAFLKGVRGEIYANKRYPSVAKRRHLQGVVHVVFTILANGEITNIQTSGASRLLQKAARKSILKSSPVSIPSKILGQFPLQNVSINIDFKLQ